MAIPQRQPSNGFPLTRDDLNATYAIILHNVRNYRSAGVVEVVRGRQSAEAAIKKFEDSQTSAAHSEGWRYFFEVTDLKAGTDPAHATNLRQADLETRESKALQETNTFIPSSPTPQK